jgi:glucose-1-phosphate adenylyltransferase
MNSTLGIIITGGNNLKMKDLTAKRSVSATAYGGRYRAIDFVLSNMINSGINKVGVVTQYSYRSLMDHLGSGKEWDLDRRMGGLFLFPPYLAGEGSGWYRGSADGMYHNISFLKRSNEEYVLITTGNCIYKMIYEMLLEKHKETEADITVCTRDMSDINPEELKHFGIVTIGEDDRITEMFEKPMNPKGNMASIGVYLLKRTLLMDLLEESASQGLYDFVRDIIIKKIDQLNIKACIFDGYWRSLSSIPMFYQANMELLKPEVRKELFVDNGKVFTKVKDETPAKYNEEAEVSNSIIADGCIIEGTVVNSVLFRGVKVGRGTVIRDCIIMQDTKVQDNVSLNNVILDKEVLVTEGKVLKGEDTYPFVVGKGVVI